jgi:hypothetical protein
VMFSALSLLMKSYRNCKGFKDCPSKSRPTWWTFTRQKIATWLSLTAIRTKLRVFSIS